MEIDRNSTGWIAAAAALAGGSVLLWGRTMRPKTWSEMSWTELPAAGYQRGAQALTSATEAARDVALRSPGGAIAGLAALAAGAYLYSTLRDRGSSEYGTGSSVEQSIDVEVPVSTAYNQWTQFEEFPRFMETVEEVRQIDNTHLHWRANVAGKTKEWDAEITEQIPDKRIAWRSTGGVKNAGAVTFHKIAENRTRIMLQLEYEPESIGERVGASLGGVKLTARGNLQKFKKLIESRGAETGSWRGTVTQH